MNNTPPIQPLPPFDVAVDARGLSCPLPILRTKKALAQMQSGQIVRVATTDRNAVRDFQAFSTQTGNTLLAQAFSTQTGNTLLAQEQGDGEVLHFLRRR